MGSAVGQVPEYIELITGWAKKASQVPVLVKLTPNITDITVAARAAQQGGADGVALINTISSLVGLDLDTWETRPAVRGRGSHGGYSGPAVKPIALNMVSAIAKDPRVRIPISGIGGIETWRDAVEFMLVGASAVQVCTAVMHHGYRIVEDMIDGLAGYLAGRGLVSPADLVGRVLPRIGDWGELRPVLCGQGPDRRRDLHPLQPVLPGLRGRRAPGDHPRADERVVDALDRRRRVRRLPALPARLPGRRLHQHGGGRRRRSSRTGRAGAAGLGPDELRRDPSERRAQPGEHREVADVPGEELGAEPLGSRGQQKIDRVDPLVRAPIHTPVFAGAIGQSDVHRQPVDLIEQSLRYGLLAGEHAAQDLHAHRRDAQQARTSESCVPDGGMRAWYIPEDPDQDVGVDNDAHLSATGRSRPIRSRYRCLARLARRDALRYADRSSPGSSFQAPRAASSAAMNSSSDRREPYFSSIASRTSCDRVLPVSIEARSKAALSSAVR